MPADRLVVIFGLVTICVVLAYCAWRFQVMNDLINTQMQVFNRIMENQATIIGHQRETLEILRRRR